MHRTIFATLVTLAVSVMSGVVDGRESSGGSGLAGGGQAGAGCSLEQLGTVSAQASSSAPVPAGWRRAGGGPVTRTGRLGHDCVSPNWNGELARYYRFELTRAAEVEVTITSSEIGTWVGLREGAALGGSLMAQASAWAGDVARVTARLSAGAYTVEASSPEEGVAATGPFTIAVEARNAAEPVRIAGGQQRPEWQNDAAITRTDRSGADRMRIPDGASPSLEETMEWLIDSTATAVRLEGELPAGAFAGSVIDKIYLSQSGGTIPDLGFRSRLPELIAGESVGSCELWFSTLFLDNYTVTMDYTHQFHRQVTTAAFRLDIAQLSRVLGRTQAYPQWIDYRVSQENAGGAVLLRFRSPIDRFAVTDTTSGNASNTTEGELVRSSVSEVQVPYSSSVSAERVQNAIAHLARLCGNDSVGTGDVF